MRYSLNKLTPLSSTLLFQLARPAASRRRGSQLRDVALFLFYSSTPHAQCPWGAPRAMAQLTAPCTARTRAPEPQHDLVVEASRDASCVNTTLRAALIARKVKR